MLSNIFFSEKIIPNAEPFCVIAQDGSVDPKMEFALCDPQISQDLYKLMVQTRLFDSKAIFLQKIGRLGTYPSSFGQEAIGAAIGKAMKATDVFCPSYRDYAAQLARGVKMHELFMYWSGDERANNYQNCNDFPMCITIAAQCLHAAGVAFALKRQQSDRACLVICGDGATSEGDFYEALNAASVWKLPFVCVVINNNWAISTNRKNQTGSKTIAQKALGFGLDFIQADGNDAVGMYYLILEALKNARNNRPVLIEALTYRLGNHTTADDASRYRAYEEVERAKKLEPLIRLKIFLEKAALWDESMQSDLIKQSEELIENELKILENYVQIDKKDMFNYTHANE